MIEITYSKLKYERKKKGLSTRDLEELSGVSKTEISDIERGVYNPTLFTMCLLSRALTVEITSLFEVIEK